MKQLSTTAILHVNTIYSSRFGSIFWLMSIIFLLTACGNEEQKESAEVQGYFLDGDTITLAEDSNIIPQISYHTVSQQVYNMEWNTAGIVRAIPNSYAEVAPPFAGRVIRSYVRLGQKVKQGSPIFEISSPDFFSAQKDYFDAKQELRLAEQNLKRQQDLFKNGVGVQRELEEADTGFETAKSALANATAALQIFNIDLSSIALGKPLVVQSPITGEVVNNQIVIGQYVKEDAAPLAIVAELSKIWIAGQIKEKDIHHIRAMDQVEIQVSGLPNRLISGKIFHINEMVDEETRSVEVLIECDNADRSLKPGMYVTVLFKDAPLQSILIPAKSIFQQEKNQYVFVQIGPNTFEKRQVETGESVNDAVLVTSGLRDGDIIVQDGGIFLTKGQ